MYIGIDFDGTCVEHAFPNIGKDIGAVPFLKQLVQNGHKLILFTMRSHPDDINKNRMMDGSIYDKDLLQKAIDWFKEKDIELFGINENPTQWYWTSSPKAYAQLYIDDCCLGIPLNEKGNVDWISEIGVGYLLYLKNLITAEQLIDCLCQSYIDLNYVTEPQVKDLKSWLHTHPNKKDNIFFTFTTLNRWKAYNAMG